MIKVESPEILHVFGCHLFSRDYISALGIFTELQIDQGVFAVVLAAPSGLKLDSASYLEICKYDCKDTLVNL